MYCDFCGHLMNDEDNFCIKCGKRAKLKNNSNSAFVCKHCGKLKSNITSKVCPKCYKFIEGEVMWAQHNIDRFSTDISRGYKRLEPYLARYRKVYAIYKKLYYYADLMPKEIVLEPKTFKEMEKRIFGEIERLANEEANFLINRLETLGDASYLADLSAVKEEIDELRKEYKEFAEPLNTIRIVNIIETYK